jgi:putative redox protein
VKLNKRKLQIVDYRVEVTGYRPDAVPSPFQRILTRHIFDVPGLDMATAQRFVDLATNKYCSVGASLKAEVEYEVELLHDVQGHEAEAAL